MKKIAFTIFLLALLLNAAAQQEYYTTPQQENIFVCDGMWFRQTSDSTVEVRKNAFEGLTVQNPLVIPETAMDTAGETYTVTRIGDRAFFNKNIADITLPYTLQEIGADAFEMNTSLHSITFPTELRRIEEEAFGGCRLAGIVELPDSLEYIDPSAFYYNRVRNAAGLLQNSITGYTIAHNPHFRTIDGILYTIDSTELVMAPGALSDTIYVQPFVRHLGEGSLADCAATHLILNDSLREISCWVLPLGITNIMIPASVTYIEGNMTGSYNKPTITVDSASRHYRTEDQMLLSYDGDTLVMGFGDWQGAKELPEGIRVMCRAALHGIRSTSDSIILPNSLEEIGDEAFMYSSVKIDFSPNIRKIGTNIFFWATNTRSVTMPNSLTDVADYALANSFIETITIGDSLRVIPRGFTADSPVSRIYFGRSVEHIMPEAFAGHRTLTIGSDNYLPASLRTIGRDAFRNANIARVKFHRNPDTVGEYAFNRTQRVFFYDTVPPVVYDSSFLDGCDVYVPCRGTAIFSAAPGWGPMFHYIESPCPPVAVDEPAVEAFRITAVGNLLTVERTEAVEVGVYDLLGRCLLRSPAATGILHFRAPASGLYIVRAGNATTKALLW